MQVDSKYKVIAYVTSIVNGDESYEYLTDELNWIDARNKAIEKACSLRETSDQKNKYAGIELRIEMVNQVDPSKLETYTLLNGKRMHSPEITEILWQEANLMRNMGYSFDAVNLTDENGKSGYVVCDHHIKLYYFTA
jgi:hypothetical protein